MLQKLTLFKYENMQTHDRMVVSLMLSTIFLHVTKDGEMITENGEDSERRQSNIYERMLVTVNI